ncbi:hypothetical protein [Streptomyces sp. NPDC048057]|uniref:hypothetical protein n=1 Tax=Streptomyces sp. NPDC048057 TaxID=3155628 RepID=UPI00340599A1
MTGDQMVDAQARQWERPAWGREPAAAALLAWLADPAAPRLCLVTGSAGSGKSGLLAWLAGHGMRPGTPAARRVHATVPLRGTGVRGAVWEVAAQLGLVARAPAELVAALAADERPAVLVLADLDGAATPRELVDLIEALLPLTHVRLLVETTAASPAHARLAAHPSAVMDLDDARWTDPVRHEEWRAAAAPAPAPEARPAEVVDLAEPARVVAADPLAVTTAYETTEEDHGGLRRAWLRAGQSLSTEDDPAVRALVLRAALGDGADPRLAGELAALADGAPWRLVWSRVRDDLLPPWPGPVVALAAGYDALDGRLLAVDPLGALRSLRAADATALGRLPRTVPQAVAVAALGDGTVLTLDRHGDLALHGDLAVPKATGLAALVDDGSAVLAERIRTVGRALARHGVRTSAAVTGLLVAGDDAGVVHAYGLPPGAGADADACTAVLHDGPVTAVAVAELGGADADRAPVHLLYSGGADGRVRAWGPATDPMPAPVAERAGVPVVALAAARTGQGPWPALAVAWADGLVEVHPPYEEEGGGRAFFRPGPPVRALALTPRGLLVVGTDEMTVCLEPAVRGEG